MNTSLWEILVPTERNKGVSDDAKNPYYTTRYHRVWDDKVRAITGGLTIMTPAKGQWVSPSGETFVERMIPVRIVATREQIEQIIDMTMEYYNQHAVLCYKLSDEVILKQRNSALAPAKECTYPMCSCMVNLSTMQCQRKA